MVTTTAGFTGAGPGLLLLTDLLDQLIADAAQILLALGRLLEHLDAGACPRDAGAEITIHLHQADPSATVAAAVMNQRFLQALEIGQGDGQVAIAEQHIQKFVITDGAAAVRVMGPHQGLEALGIGAVFEHREHHRHLLQAQAAAAVTVDQIKDFAQVAAEIEAPLAHGPDSELMAVDLALLTGQLQELGTGFAGETAGQVGQGPLSFRHGNLTIAIGIKQAENQIKLAALQLGLGRIQKKRSHQAGAGERITTPASIPLPDRT